MLFRSQNETYVYVNVSTSDASNYSAFIDWNKSLVGYWSFDSYNSTGIYDNSTYNNFGTFNGANFGVSNITTGKRGKALSFDGVDDYVNTGSNIDLSNKNFTLSAWAKRESSGTWDIVFWQGIGSANNGLHFGFRNTNVFTCSFWGNDLDTVATYTDSNWHYWGCTYNANTNKRIIYRDGVNVANNTASATYQGSGPLTIGYSSTIASQGINNHFNGSIDEAQIYNRVLSPQEINATYQAGSYKLFNNFTGLYVGNYTYKAYAIDASGNTNSTKERSVTITGIINSCQTLNTAGITYTLQNDVSINGSTCFTITANNITLDGNGYTINGNKTSGTYGVYASGRNNLTIKNFKNITDFERGIYLTSSSNNNTIINNTVNSNGYGILLDATSNNNTITNNTANSNSNMGLAIYDSLNNAITRNT